MGNHINKIRKSWVCVCVRATDMPVMPD